MKPSVVAFLALSLLPSVALADALPPSCEAFYSGLTACDAASVDQACPDGGVCRLIDCDSRPSPSIPGKTYRCTECKVKVDDPGSTCILDGSNNGKPCGDGGTCENLAFYCPGGTDAPTCVKLVAAGSGGSGQGGEAGAAGAAQAGQAGAAQAGQAGSAPGGPAVDESDSGCVVSSAGRQGALAALMVAVGALVMLAERRRR